MDEAASTAGGSPMMIGASPSHRFDEFIRGFLDETLHAPLMSFMQRPRKGVREKLVRLGAVLTHADVDSEQVQKVCDLVEAVHCGSLIVDDIQDDSPVRREHPSLHRQVGVSKALNAGNWLYFWALQEIRSLNLKEDIKRGLLDDFLDMFFEGHCGQALDLGRRIETVPAQHVPSLCLQAVKLKTGSLTSLALASGARLGQPADLELLKIFGVRLGVLLQQLDDLKNLKLGDATVAEPDQKAFEDLRNGRPTYLWWFATEHLDSSCHRELASAVEDFPQLEKLRQWQEKYDFHAQALEAIQCDFTRFEQDFERYATDHKLDTKVLPELGTIFHQLESAYEQTR
ncbi:MAG: hypothetical protein CL675_02920 [Bdellovibrionaceae bacterium]|nr:hypothetical protein [Pseudobdellovibrionaceae bacterium]